MDPNFANNTAVATASTLVPSSSCITTTDIQVTGAAQNGNPIHGTSDVFTWQIKNNLGNVAANNVTFAATTTAPNLDVLAISATNPGGRGTPPNCTFTATTVNCNLGTIAGGATATVTVSATPSLPAPANSYSMTGNATFNGIETNPANNSFTVFIGAQ
jgi:hypothetical protein